MLNQNLLLTGDDGYNLTNSLRFRASASAYLNRTPASAGNRKTWTFSAWVKRGKLTGDNTILNAGYSSIPWFILSFTNDNSLSIAATAGSSASWKTTATFRDPSAWYHIVCVVDTTSATSTMNGSSTDRFRLYVNNVQYVITGGSVPSQNSDLQVNNTVAHTVGGYSGEYFDGYMTEVNLIDGQALTPSSFGSTNALTGVWQPARYTGTYGTNGFYLPFTDNSALTTSSNVGLGKDFSGNGNYWTTNNISITAGTTYDSMTDVPTLTSATASNFCTLNPLKSNSSTSTYQNGNLQVTFPNAGAGGIATGTIAVSSGKFYWEVTVGGTDGSTQPKLGIISPTVQTETSSSIDVGDLGYAYGRNGNKSILGSVSSYGASFTTNDVIGFALDMDAGTLVCYKNNSSQGTLVSGLNGLFTVGLTAYNGYSETINFGQRPFAYTPPTGFVALNTFNLPTSTIVKGNKYMDVNLYTGNGGIQSLTMGFAPDLAWQKARSIGYAGSLYDSVRGATKQLSSVTTDAEDTRNGVTSFNSNGVTLGDSGRSNDNGQTYVNWAWKAGGTGVTNTAGSITSTVSVNPTAGFSVVTYTGSGSNGTVGHGLGVAPRMIFVKDRTQGGTYRDWAVYNADIGAGNALFLNDTTGSFSKPSYWNSTTATSSVFSLGSDITVNQSGDAYVAYCWSQIAGYSAFGSYTGNGSSDGPFVYLGFRPAFVMIKQTNTSGNDWVIRDNKRAANYNVINADLFPNTSGAETSDSFRLTDFVSNGFKIRNTGSGSNTSGSTYIYMAFAENPFRNSLAR
jgi:hypothetical protein